MRRFLLLALFPMLAQAGTLALTVDAANPSWDNDVAISADELKRLYVRLYGAKQGAAKTLLDAQPWSPAPKFVRTSASISVHCYDARYAYDRDGDGLPDVEGPPTAEACGTFQNAPIVLNLTAPNGVTLESPAQ